MAASVIQPYQIAATAKHTATIIFLHGLGDSGAGWLPFAEASKKALPHVKWVLPNAPTRSITVNMGMSMPGWFDIYSFDTNAKEDRDGLLDSARTIDKHIQAEIEAGIPAERIVVGGFSQGGCMSLLAGLTARGDGLFGGKDGWKLGGVVDMSGFMPLRNEFADMVSPHFTKTPVLVCHGTADPIVPCNFAEMTSHILTNILGATGLTFKAYQSLGHETCQEETRDVVEFFKRVLPP